MTTEPSTMPNGPAARIPLPILTGLVSGILASLAITLLNILPGSQGHAVLIAAVATPCLAFAFIDGTPRSIGIETVVAITFVTVAFLAFDASPWVVAGALAAHGNLGRRTSLHPHHFPCRRLPDLVRHTRSLRRRHPDRRPPSVTATSTEGRSRPAAHQNKIPRHREQHASARYRRSAQTRPPLDNGCECSATRSRSCAATNRPRVEHR